MNRSDGPAGLDDLRATLGSTRVLFEAAACSCALTSDDGSQLRFVAADGAGAEHIVGVSIPVNRGIAGWVALSGQPTAIADVARDDRFARDVAEATTYVPTAIWAVPMVDPQGETIGVVEVLDPGRTDLDLGVLAVIASQVEAVIRLGGVGDPADTDPELLRLAGRLAPGQVPLARSLLTALVENP